MFTVGSLKSEEVCIGTLCNLVVPETLYHLLVERPMYREATTRQLRSKLTEAC